MRASDQRHGYVNTDLLSVWTDPDTAIEAVGTSLGMFEEGGSSPATLLAANDRLRTSLHTVLLKLVEGGVLEARPCGGGRDAYRWRSDTTAAVAVADERLAGPATAPERQPVPSVEKPWAWIRRKARGCRQVAWSRHRKLTLITAVLLVFAVGAATDSLLLVTRISRFDVQVHRSLPGGTTYLIVGSDSRANLSASERVAFGTTPGARADIMLLVRVPANGGPPALLSIPRDLLVLGADFGLHRLALQWLDGPQSTLDTLCSSLGVGVDHVVVFDLSGFARVVDSVGGVDVETPFPVRDTVINFSLGRGHHHLNGDTALQYVRARHLEERTASGWVPIANQRAEQARTVLLAVGHKARLGWNPLDTQRMLWAATGDARFDQNMGLGDMIRLARALPHIAAGANIEIPSTLTNGSIPHAALKPGAGRALQTIGAGGPDCPRASMTDARFS